MVVRVETEKIAMNCERGRLMCCWQEVRWRGQGAKMLWMKGRRNMLWWSGKDGVGGVGVMVKVELCEKMVQVRRVSCCF